MSYLRIFLTTVFVWGAAAPPARAAERFDAAVAKLSRELLAKTRLKGKRVAVGEFKNADGGVTALSAHLAEAIELQLAEKARSQGMHVMDRRNFQELVKEWELGVFGYVDDEAITQAGKLLGVNVLCFGKHRDKGKRKINLRLTLVDAESGEILAAASRDFKADKVLRKMRGVALKKPRNKPAADKAEEAADDELKVELWTEKDAYRLGDMMSVSVKVNQDAYLTLIDVGTSGTATILYPNHYAPSNAVKAGVTYVIPGPTAGFEFEVAAPTGTEIIRAIASREPIVVLEDAMGSFDASKPFGGLKKDPAILTRDIHVKAKKAKKGTWAEAVVRLKIRD